MRARFGGLARGWRGLLGQHPVDRVRRFFTEDVWEVNLGELRPGKALVYRVSRLLSSTVRGFDENQLTFRAAALTYFTVLSIVPFLAFAFSVLKGFGAYQTFIEGTVRPYLRSTFAGNPSLYDAIERILQFVEATDFSSLGTLGLIFLVYTSVSLLSSVEVALNDIWGVKTQRPFVRQITDYVTLLVTAPILVVAAATVGTAAQSSNVILFLRNTLELGGVIDFFLRFTSLVVVGVAMLATYMILPNVRVRPWSAVVGAAVAAVLWQIALVAHVRFQLGVARYNAIYSVLGAIPIFFVWAYFSWLAVLIGAQLAASHQNEQAARQRMHARRADQALKETLAIAVAAQVARDFLDNGPRRTHTALAELLEVPPPAVEEVVDRLARAGLLARTLCGREIGYLPGRDLDAIRLKDLQDALRREEQAEGIRAGVERQLGAELQGILHGIDEDLRGSSWNLTLRELAARVGNGHAAPHPSGSAPPPEGPHHPHPHEEEEEPVLDAKQPEVSA